MTRYGAILLAGLVAFGCGESDSPTATGTAKHTGGLSNRAGNQSGEATLERELDALSRIAQLTTQERVKARKVLSVILRMRGGIAARGSSSSRELERLREQTERALAPVVPNEREALLHQYVLQSRLFSDG